MPDIEAFKALKQRLKINTKPLNKDNIPTQDPKNLSNVLEELTSPYKKQVSNGLQIGSKRVAEQVANGLQIGSKLVSTKELDNELGSKRVAEQVAQKVAEQVAQKRYKGSNPVATFVQKTTLSMLVGVQRKIILFFYFLVKKTGTQFTGSLSLDYIANSIEIKKNVVKDAINRLQKKGYIERELGKIGKGGWTVYKLSNSLYQELMHQDNIGYLDHKIGSKWVAEQVAQKVAEQVATIYSSSSNINNIKTTTTEGLTEEWSIIDIYPLEDLGFTKYHLRQLEKQQILSAQEVQDSINHFAFAIERNDKLKEIKGDPLNYLMGTLKRGTPYLAPSNYVSPQQEAREKLLEQREQARQKEKELNDRELECDFSDWYDNLSQEVRDKIKPRMRGLRAETALITQRAELKEYFRDNIWKKAPPGTIKPSEA